VGRGSLAGATATVALVLIASAAGAEAAGEDGLPALVRVPLASALEPGWAFSAASGYGYHDAVLGDGDSHHRLSGSLFAALPLQPWLALAAGIEGRYDRHLDVPGGTDDGWISQPVLALSAVHAQAPAGVGARARVWLPGRGSFDPVPEAASADLSAFARFSVAPVTLAASAGFRLDRSAASVERPEDLTAADRMALGVSDSDAVLLGAGLSLKLGGLEVV
jgi:hypothetical protein